MKFDDSVLTPALGPKVLKVLQRLTPLPTTGIVAGQSVASALDEVLGVARPVYNDVDCFVNAQDSPGEEAALWERRRANGTLAYWSEQELESSGYRELLEVQRRQLYDIKRTRREGLLNTVEVGWNWRPHWVKATMAQDLVSVFDINATQAAVDLGTGELVVTAAFRHYFRTRQLQLETLFTPVHSLLRLLKKSQELPLSFVNLPQSVQMVYEAVKNGQGPDWLAALRQDGVEQGSVFVDQDELKKRNWAYRPHADCPQGLWVRVGESLEQTPLCFGRKYRELCEHHARALEPWFDITQNPRGNLWLASAKLTESSEKRTAVQMAVPNSPTTAHSKAWIEQHFGGCGPLSSAQRFRQWSMPQRALVLERRQRFERWTQLLVEPKQQTLLAKAYRLQGDDYLQGLNSDRQLKELVRVQNEHPEFFWAALALPFEQQYKLLKSLRKLFKAHNLPEAWGVLHQKESPEMRRVLANPVLLEEMVKELVGTNEPYVVSLPVPLHVDLSDPQTGEMARVEVVQLLSQLQLNAEGAKMSHCVAGYGHAVKGHRSRIVSFRAGERAAQRATAEWIFEEDRNAEPFCQVKRDNGDVVSVYPLKVHRQQLRSLCNQEAPALLEQAECVAREALNAWLQDQGEQSWELLKPGHLSLRLEQLQAPARPAARPSWKPQANAGFELEEDIPW